MDNDFDFKPVLLKSRISGNYMNPGETLWVTLTWQNVGNTPAPKNYQFFLDGSLGHQRRLENKRCEFRVTAESLPPTSMWEKGMTVDVTFKWEILTNWSGTYHLYAGMMDKNTIPVMSAGKIGSVDISWNLGRPWVIENTQALENIYNAPIAFPSNKSVSAFTLKDHISVELECSRPAIKSIGNYRFDYAKPYAVILDGKTGESLTETEENCRADYTLIKLDKLDKLDKSDKNENNIAIYHMQIFVSEVSEVSDKQAVEADIVFELKERVLKISVENIIEYADFTLLEYKFNSLAELDDGYLLDFFGSGRLVPIQPSAKTPKTSKPFKTSTPVWFEKKYDVRNAAVLYDKNGMIIIESTHIDSKISTGIINVNGQSRGVVGGSIVTAIKGENSIPPTSAISAISSISVIKVKEPPVFKIELADLTALQGQPPDWQFAARLLQRGVHSNNARDLYRGVYFYKQLATWGPIPDEKYRAGKTGKPKDSNPLTQSLFKTVRFDEITENVRKFSNLTDGAKQVMYITGWQKGGFDNAYPYPYDAEERCGGLSGLRSCLEETRKYNTMSGLHDNFDDISYMHSDFPYAAIDETGEKWRGWIWAGGMTYNIGMKKYADSGAMADRVNKMTSLLPLKDTYHIDVLTAEVCRYDFDPENPASAEDNFKAKMSVIDEFNKHGIDITSELLVHPAVSKIGFALHTRLDTDQTFIPGDCFVPLVQMIYHGIIGYCCPSDTKEQILWGLLLGGHTFYEQDITKETCVSRYYIQNIPAMMLYDKKMTGFSYNNKRTKVRADYENNSFVEVDFDTEKYTVVIDGTIAAKDFTVFINSENSYLTYSLNGGEIVYPLPECFKNHNHNNHKITAVRLTEEGESADVIDVIKKIDGENLTLDLPPMTPVKIITK